MSDISNVSVSHTKRRKKFNHKSQDSGKDNSIRCHINEDNTISFIGDKKELIDKIGGKHNISVPANDEFPKQDKILQLISQNQLSNCVISNKEYQSVSFANKNEHVPDNLCTDNRESTHPHGLLKTQRCTICELDFPSKRAFSKHMTIHENDREYKCGWCKMSYNHEINLLVHIPTIHPKQCFLEDHCNFNEKYRCLVCSRKFSREKSLQSHCIIHQIDEELICEQCPAQFNSRVLLEKHIEDHNLNTVDQEIFCKLCQRKFKSVRHINIHYNQYHQNVGATLETVNSEKSAQTIPKTDDEQNVDPYKNLCEKDQNSQTLSKGVKASSTKLKSKSTKQNQCPICNKSFNHKQSVKVHMMVHDSIKAFQCKYCSKSFTYEHNMKTHVRGVHESDKRCNEAVTGNVENISAKSSNSSDTLNIVDDQKSVFNASPSKLTKERFLDSAVISCSTSTKSSASVTSRDRYRNVAEQRDNESLVNVDEIESKVESEQPENEKSFRKRRYLSNTVSPSPSFVALRPRKCHVCRKSFHLKPALKNHFKCHQHCRSRRLSCEICAKKFVLKPVLEIHLRLHALKNLRYSCKFCEKKFSTLFHYTNHNRVEHRQSSVAGTLPRSDSTKKVVKVVDGVHDQPPGCKVVTQPYESEEDVEEQWEEPWEEPDSERKEACDQCDKLFRNVKSMQQHVRTQHINQCTFACPDCPATFAFKGSLRRHQLVHTKEKPFKCPLCFRPFKTRAYVERHLILRNGCKSGKYHLPPVEPKINKMGPNFESEILTTYGNYQPVDLDTSVVPPVLPHNLFVKQDPVGNKYVIVALNNSRGTGGEPPTKNAPPLENCQTAEEGTVVMSVGQSAAGSVSAKLVESVMSRILDYAKRQQVNELVEQSRAPVTNKFPLMEATLFSEDDTKLTPSSTDSSQEARATNCDVWDKRLRGCVTCSALFVDSETLKSHVKREHKAVREFVCTLCHKAFSVQLSLWAHSKMHPESGDDARNTDCIACDQKFLSVRSLSRHVRMQHNDKLYLYRCGHCNETYKTTRELDSHIKQISHDCDAIIVNPNLFKDQLKRPVHQKDTNYRKSSLIELRDSEIDRIVSWDMSKKFTLSEQELIKAARYKRGLKKVKASRLEPSVKYPYSCSVCHKSFAVPSHLKQHSLVHTKVGFYQCPRCTKKFTHRSSLKTHENAMHSALMKLFRCHLCMKLLRSQVSLGSHMKIHLRGRGFQCNKCLTYFPTNLEMLRHQKLKRCSATFPEDSEGREKHRVESTEDPPVVRVKCVSCCSFFGSIEDYENHGCKKLDRLLHKCSVCDESLTSYADFSSHICDANKQQGAYSCSQCSLLFKQDSSLLEHVESVHNI